MARPNVYHGEMLGASADRFHLHADLKDLEDRLNRESGPVLLDELERRMIPLWETLRKSGISDSSLRNLEQTLASRREAWRRADAGKAKEALEGLADSLCIHYFNDDEQRETVRGAIRDGFFFRTLNLYLRVLKARMEKGASDGVLQTANVPG